MIPHLLRCSRGGLPFQIFGRDNISLEERILRTAVGKPAPRVRTAQHGSDSDFSKEFAVDKVKLSLHRFGCERLFETRLVHRHRNVKKKRWNLVTFV
jgi:hypothetical protein